MRSITALALAAALSCPAWADFSGPVIGIADGDTLTVRRGSEIIKVRLTEIDAPEKAQPYGHRSRKSLSDLCYGKNARLTKAGKDRYGRTLARVECAGLDANAEQVRRGMAWAFTKYLTDPSIKAFEESARAGRVGLWADQSPVEPWDWRASRRSEEVKAR
jgi:endonuclease YncB( thermonuclease family)